MFFKVLAAIITADAFDRHVRAQQHRVGRRDRETSGSRAGSDSGSTLAPR